MLVCVGPRPCAVGELQCDCCELSDPKPGRQEKFKTLAKESVWLKEREEKQMHIAMICQIAQMSSLV